MSKEYKIRKHELEREWNDHFNRWWQLYCQIKAGDGKYVAVLKREQQLHWEEMERITAEERELDWKELARSVKEKTIEST